MVLRVQGYHHLREKTDNVLLTGGDPLVAKLADLGEARFKTADEGMTAVGTPMYSAPEILMFSESYDESVDV